MATLAVKKVVVAGSLTDSQPLVMVFGVDATQTIQGGDLVEDADSDNLAEKSRSPATDAKLILGFAIHDAKQGTDWLLGAGETGGNFGGTFGGTFMGSSGLLKSIEGIGVHVVLADPNTIFEVTLSGAFALADIGAQVGLVEGASGYWLADKAQTAKQAIIVGYPGGPDKGVPGDTNARVFIRFKTNVYKLWAG